MNKDDEISLPLVYQIFKKYGDIENNPYTINAETIQKILKILFNEIYHKQTNEIECKNQKIITFHEITSFLLDELKGKVFF